MKQNRILFQIVVLVLFTLLIVLGGCGSTRPSRFYLLSSMSEGAKAQGETEKPLYIKIGPITLPEYLDRPQIITRAGENNIQLAEFDRWAEPLKDNFTRVLAENLSMLLSTENIFLFPMKGSKSIDYTITVDVIRFEGKGGGDVILESRWTLFEKQGKEFLLKKKSSIRKSPGNKEDFEAMVSAGSKAMEDLSREIAETIQGL